MSKTSKVVVITGGSSGIGSEMAQYFASQGWDVAITYAGNAAGAESTLEAIEAAGQRGFVMHCDVGYKSEVDAFLDQVTAELGLPQLLASRPGLPFLNCRRMIGIAPFAPTLKATFCAPKNMLVFV